MCPAVILRKVMMKLLAIFHSFVSTLVQSLTVMPYENSTLAVAGVGIVLGLYLLRRHFKGPQFTERVSAKGKVVIVTGCNTGIGWDTAKELNLRGAKVYMLCRTRERAEDARIEMVKAGCDASRLIYVNLDLGSKDSVRKCAEEMMMRESHIDVLINNAGMSAGSWAKTKDGHETTWQTNHLGPFLLTELLLPFVEKAEEGRIVMVTGAIYKIIPSIDLSTVDEKEGFGGSITAYSRSKLANVSVIPTELGRDHPIYMKMVFTILKPLLLFIQKTRRDGAQTTLYAALSTEVKGVTGCYFSDCVRSKESPAALDDLACKQLYDYSLKTVGLD